MYLIIVLLLTPFYVFIIIFNMTIRKGLSVIFLNIGAIQTQFPAPINAKNGERKRSNVCYKNWRFSKANRLFSTSQLLMLWVAQHKYGHLFLRK